MLTVIRDGPSLRNAVISPTHESFCVKEAGRLVVLAFYLAVLCLMKYSVHSGRCVSYGPRVTNGSALVYSSNSSFSSF